MPQKQTQQEQQMQRIICRQKWVKALAVLASVFCLGGLEAAQLIHGPMVGAATMAEVQLWLQTNGPADVRIRYWPKDRPDEQYYTAETRTRKEDGFVAKLAADRVREGTAYEYLVEINRERATPAYREGFREGGTIPLGFSTPRNWRFRESGHEVFDFTIGFGSCAYINEPGGYDRLGGNPYGSDYQIFESIYETRPDLFIWLGDNIYYREPDWTTRTGMLHRWTHDRGRPELRPMLATIPQYATWDDHDYGPNDAGREFWNREMATEVFNLFWANPTTGAPGQDGISTYFAWGDVHFYLLDNRTFRTTPSLSPDEFGYPAQQLGKEQIDWMIELMRYNRGQSHSSYPSTFHVIAVGSQVLSPSSRDGLMQYPAEWDYLFARLVREQLHNVIFITGDVHYSEVNRAVFSAAGKQVAKAEGEPLAEDEFEFWEITSSPLTAGPWAGPGTDRNPNRYDILDGPSDRIGQRNFATLSFEGTLSERRAVIRYFDSAGTLLNADPEAAEGKPTERSVIHSRNHNLGNVR